MSSFVLSYKRVFDEEQGYWAGNSRGKKCGQGSGETYNGIDRQCWPKWQGWAILDGIPNKKRYDKFKNAALQANVVQFYKEYFSKLIANPEGVQNQDLANLTLDFLFHRSYDAAKVINLVAKFFSPSVITSSKVTADVIDVMNNYTSNFYTKLRAARIDYYNNPKKYGGTLAKSSATYTAQYIKRANSFPLFITPLEESDDIGSTFTKRKGTQIFVDF